MSRSSGIGQLAKGVLIGVVLILAVIGTMTILDKDKDFIQDDQTITNPADPTNNIPAPEISIDAPNSTKQPTASATSDEIINTDTAENVAANVKNSDTFKPVLENEVKAEDKAEPIKFGILRLASVDFETKERLMSTYEVFNSDNKKIAESKSTETTSFRLPEGQYKIISTLSPIEGARKTDPVQSTQKVTIRADSTTQKLFKMEPPTTIGVLQVSARNAKSNKIMRASFTIQKENGETIATRQNVTNTLFKLKAGSYKVSVKSGNNTDFRTVVIEPGESTKQIFKLQETHLQGKVLVRIFDTSSNQPLNADIIIADANNKTIQELTAVSKTELSLAPGRYKIRVTGPNGQSSKNITVTAGRANNEVFRFDAPAPETKPTEVQITEDVKITAPKESSTTNTASTTIISPVATPAVVEPEPTPILKTGKLTVFSRDNEGKKFLKSNFYVQTLSGKNIDKKIYADSAVFDLKPGTYRVTVRSNNRTNSVKNIQIVAGKEISEVFSLLEKVTDKKVEPTVKPNNRNVSSNQNTANNNPPIVLGGVRPTKNMAIPNGFLQVAMIPPRKTHFIVVSQSGKKIADITNVPNGKFKLDTGIYNVTAIFNNQRRSQTIRVQKGKTSRLNFSAANFQAKQPIKQKPSNGVLRSRILNQAGNPIKGDLTVTNMSGRVVARANGVSVGVFNLPPTPHTVIVNYQGLRGNEQVRIVAGETTIQTFTIAPQRGALTKQPR